VTDQSKRRGTHGGARDQASRPTMPADQRAKHVGRITFRIRLDYAAMIQALASQSTSVRSADELAEVLVAEAYRARFGATLLTEEDALVVRRPPKPPLERKAQSGRILFRFREGYAKMAEALAEPDGTADEAVELLIQRAFAAHP
jgi:hypothetical protein